MSVTYRNQKGRLYYLHRGATKAGKVRYFFSPQATGCLVAEVPAGFEITETVNGVVSLRRIKPRPIHDDELQTVRSVMAELPHLRRYRADIQKKDISNLAGKNTTLNGGSKRNNFIRIYSLVWLLSENSLDNFLDFRDTGGTADENNFSNL